MTYQPIGRMTYNKANVARSTGYSALLPETVINLPASRFEIHPGFSVVETNSQGQRRFYFNALLFLREPILSMRISEDQKEIIVQTKKARLLCDRETFRDHGVSPYSATLSERFSGVKIDQLLKIGFEEKAPNSGVFVYKRNPDILLLFKKGNVLFLGRHSSNPVVNTSIPVERKIVSGIVGDRDVMRLHSELADFEVDKYGEAFPALNSRVYVEMSIDPLATQIPDKKVTLEDIRSNVEIFESRMRPDQASSEGFIDHNDSLLEILSEDDTFVKAMQLTHQEMAHPLLYAMRLGEMFGLDSFGRTNSHALEYCYGGQNYKLYGGSYLGSQNSPFNDGLWGKTDFTIERDGKTFSFSELTALLIYYYGFYNSKTSSYEYSDGGRKVSANRYRVDPQEVIDFFGIKSKE